MRGLRHVRWLLSLLAIPLACAHSEPARSPPPEEQSYPEALRLMCGVDHLSGANPDDPLDVPAKREDFLLAHVKNGDGIYFLTIFRTKPAKEQAEMLAKEAREQSIQPCALVSALRAEASEGSTSEEKP